MPMQPLQKGFRQEGIRWRLALTSDAYESKGGDVMSDFEMLSLFCMIVSLVLVAIELGRNIGNQNKK